MENNVVVSDYAAMDRILREERKHILGICKKIKKAGCNVLLIQKSILRDAYNDLSLHFLAKVCCLQATNECALPFAFPYFVCSVKLQTCCDVSLNSF
jgi:T-complex protein 1 subunit delta